MEFKMTEMTKMNERIKKLIEQATSIEYGADNGFDRVTFDKEKFAELIVKECVKVTLESIYHNGIGDVNDCIIVGNDVAEHFGVEE
jgi:hypothetical protein